MTIPGLPEIKIGCSTTDCKNDLHCFNHVQREAGQRSMIAFTDGSKTRRGHLGAGACGACGVQLVHWDRVHKRDLQDAAATFDFMRKEWIRHHFWHCDFNERAINHARGKGRVVLMASVRHVVGQAVGRERHPAEGMQVPTDPAKMSTTIQYALHAVAACCRKCVEKWHNIEIGRPLTDQELDYLTALASKFLEERLPADLLDEPVKVPRRRRKPDAD